MRKLSLLAVCWVGSLLAAAPVTPTPLGVFRTRLMAGDPDRNWTYFWTQDGSLKTAYTVTQVGQSSTQAPRIVLPLTGDTFSQYHGGLSVTRPGTYAANVGRGTELQLTVVTAAAQKPWVVQPGNSAAAVKQAIAAGGNPVTLLPGEHVWDQMVVVPAGVTLRGYGATVRRVQAAENYGGNWPSVYVGGQDVSVYGVTFVYDFPGEVFMSNPQQYGLVVGDCTFKRCNFGFYFQNSFVRDCTFDGGGAVIAPSGLWLRDKFIGPGNQHAWDFWYGLGPVAMISCSFDRTDRGPIFNGANGSISDCLFVDVHCSGINWVPNGNEIFLCEGVGAFDRNLFFHTRIVGCQSTIFQMDQASHNCVVNDLFMDGGIGVLLWGRDISGWSFQNFELRNGAGIYCGPNATRCSFVDGSVIRWAPGRGNQAFPNKTPLLLARTTAVLAEGPNAATNTLTRVDVEDMPAKYTGVIGFGVGP